ncbi:MAG: PAS domain S-box protein, partial [Dissulfurispiraceae bacterium]
MHDKLISSLKIISGKEHLRIVGIALAYFFAHQLAFMFPDAEQVIMALWPAGGIGLAAFLLNPLRLWPAIILSFYVAGVSADVFLAHRTFFASVGYMTGNMVESVGCALLIIRCCGRDVRFERLREVLVLAAGVIFVNAFSSCIGAGTALLIRGASFWNAWLSWYVSDGLGVLLLTPLIVSWIGFLDFSRSVRWGRVAEAIAFMVLWCAATWLSFKPDMATHAFSPHPYMLSALLVWPALRFGQRGTTLALVVMGCIAISSNTASWSPEFLGGESPVDRLLALQVFVGFTSIVGFLLAATFSETRRSEEALRKLNEHLDLKVKERTGELEQEIAERKKAEGSLLLLQYAVDYAEDSIFWIRPDASFANVNNATCQRLGYTRNELLGMSVFDIDPAFPREAWDSHWREIKERKSFAIETKHKTKGGEIFPVEVSVNYVEYEGEEYNFAFAKDITQRKEAENALRNANELLEAQVKRRTTELQSVNEQLQRELADRKKSEELLIKSEEKFSKFFMFAPAAISVSSLDEGRIFDINKEYERVLGYSRDEVIGSTSRELGLFVDVKEREQIARILRAGGHVKDFELHLYNKSGKVTTLRYCGEMTEIENVSYLLSSFVDITDRKQAEQALEQAATEWSAAMDASEDVIYLLDIKRHVIRANKAFYTMTGKTPENAIGVHIVEILHPDKTPDLCPVCRAQEEKLDTVIIMEKDHECNPVGRPLEITVRILRDKQGQPISIFTMIHDLSRDRKSQEEKT